MGRSRDTPSTSSPLSTAYFTLCNKPITTIGQSRDTPSASSPRSTLYCTYSKPCDNIGIFIQNYKSTNHGQIKLCMGPVNENPKNNLIFLMFEYAKSYFCAKVKKSAGTSSTSSPRSRVNFGKWATIFITIAVHC